MTWLARLVFHIGQLRQWLGRIFTKGLLFLVYGLVLGPIALCRRLLGKDTLEGVPYSERNEWIKREPAAHDLDRLRKLF